MLGALINSVFLIALCFSITVEAIQRFFEPSPVDKPQLVLYVGIAGLCVNVVGLFLFHDHSHGGHSHGGHDHGAHSIPSTQSQDDLPEYPMSARIEEYKKRMDSPVRTTPATQQPKNSHLNMRGVFLHVLGDALGSVAVIISALVIWLSSWPERYIIDPILSLVIVAIILFGTIPLVKTTSLILLQATPNSIPIEELRLAIKSIDQVQDVHDFHVWQLSDTKYVASVHVVCGHDVDFMDLARRIKLKLHDYGVHSTTVQPEYAHDHQSVRSASPGPSSSVESADVELQVMDEGCLLPCKDPSCAPNECCSPSDANSVRKRNQHSNHSH